MTMATEVASNRTSPTLCLPRYSMVRTVAVENDNSFDVKEVRSRQLREVLSTCSVKSGHNFTGPRSASAPPDTLKASLKGSNDHVVLSDTGNVGSSPTYDGGTRRAVVATVLSEADGNSESSGSGPNQNPDVIIIDVFPKTTQAGKEVTETVSALADVPVPVTAVPVPPTRKGSVSNGSDPSSGIVQDAGERNGLQSVISSGPREEDAVDSGVGASSREIASHRPHPVKTIPPVSFASYGGGRVALVAPTTPRACPNSPTRHTTAGCCRGVVAKVPSKTSYRRKERKSGREKLSLARRDLTRPLRGVALGAAKARHPEQDAEKREQEIQRKREEIQCDFPESGHLTMPPSTGGRGLKDGDSDVHAKQTKQYTGQTENLHQIAHRMRGPTSVASSNGGNRGVRSATDPGNSDEEAGSRVTGIQPTPLFERLVTEEVQELKAYARIIENQNRQLSELERVHRDLEARLEIESSARQQLEATLESREREWSRRFEELESDRDQWKKEVQTEQEKNSRLIDQVVRKDQDIHRMLQRKYDHEGLSSTTGRSIRGTIRQQSSYDRIDRAQTASGTVQGSRSPEFQSGHHKSPHEILAASGSAENARRRNVKGLLLDFFAL